MKVFRNIDWVTMSVKDVWTMQEDFEWIRSPVPFYQNAMRGKESGILVCGGNPNSDGNLIVLSGKTCEHFGLDESKAPEFLDLWINTMKAKISRIDMAVTVENGPTVDNVRKWVSEGFLVGPQSRITAPKKTVLNDDDGRAETFYIGDMKKRAKRGIVRVYDKGREQGLTPDMFTRFEIEEKRETAHTQAKAIIRQGNIGSVMRKRLDFSIAEWEEITSAIPAPDVRDRARSAEKDKDTYGWWVMTIAPALARHVFDDVNGTLSEDFWRAYDKEMNRLIQAKVNSLTASDEQ